MLVHPQFDPVAIYLGPLQIRWYGLMYLISFGVVWGLGRVRVKSQPGAGWTLRDLEDMIFFGVLGVILGGRLGYVLFYKPAYYFAHPLEIPAVWQGGMSFHGGFLGVLLAMVLFARARGKSWLRLMDFVAPLCPLGLALGRIGNFINGELPGRMTNLPWGMVFPPDTVARHPSQLYQAALEGVALFVIVWLYSSKPRPPGAVSAVFLTGYGVFRFIAEFAREPDDFLGLLAFNLSMGQWLSVPMIVAGVLLWQQSMRRRFA
jgi:phosphatidylglycerol---prolipoprotein diacylglyceryl transferase